MLSYFDIFDDRENDWDCENRHPKPTRYYSNVQEIPENIVAYHLKEYVRKSRAIKRSGIKNKRRSNKILERGRIYPSQGGGGVKDFYNNFHA